MSFSKKLKSFKSFLNSENCWLQCFKSDLDMLYSYQIFKWPHNIFEIFMKVHEKNQH